MAHGVVLAEHGKLSTEFPRFDYPAKAKSTVHMKRAVTVADFDIKSPTGANQVKARVIGVVENQAPTKSLTADLQVNSGLVAMDRDNDICQIALVERHKATGKVINAFVSGFGYNRPCAIASTVAHDSHHMIVIGTSKADMAQAANVLRDIGGGIVVVSDGVELARIELPIAGLMSAEPAEIVAAKAEKMVQAMRDCGCTLNNAYMQHSLLGLVVIPELRISDLGLVDVTTFKTVDLFIPT
jgi:adenine deaminase